MPKNPVAPESSVYSVSGGGVGVAGPATPAAGASGRTANFSAATTTNSSYAGSGSVGTGKKLSTNGDVRIPLHPSQPRDDNQECGDSRADGQKRTIITKLGGVMTGLVIICVHIAPICLA